MDRSCARAGGAAASNPTATAHERTAGRTPMEPAPAVIAKAARGRGQGGRKRKRKGSDQNKTAGDPAGSPALASPLCQGAARRRPGAPKPLRGEGGCY